MPVLDLSSVSPGRAYWRLLAVMYVPHNSELRSKFEAAGEASATLEMGRRLYDPAKAQGTLANMMAAAALEPQLSEVRREMAAVGLHVDAHAKGANAAMILRLAILTGDTLDKVKKAWATQAGKEKRRGLSEATLQRDWLEYRSVSHIWAGHILTIGPPRRNIVPAELLNILRVADDHRRAGEAQTSGNRQVPLLGPDEAWTFS